MTQEPLSLDLLKILADNLKEMAAILDHSGAVLYINRTALDLVSESEDAIIGVKFWDTPWWTYSSSDRDALINAFETALKGITSQFEATHVDRKGKLIYTDFTMTPVFNQAGLVQYLIPEGRNITALKIAQEVAESTEEKYRKLFTSSMDAMLIIDEYTFTDFNQTAISMFGFTTENPMQDLGPGTLSPEFQMDGTPSSVKSIEMMNLAYQNGSHRFEWLHKRRNGEVFPTEVVLTAIPDLNKQILYAIVRDITQQKQHEATIYELNRNLENLVYERTQELEKSISNLKDTQEQMIEQEKMATLGTLVAGITHDLSTPLGNAVMASSYLLKEFQAMKEMFATGAISKSKFEHFIEDGLASATSVVRNLDHATQQITSFKNIAVDQSNESVRQINLKNYLEEIVSTFHSRLKKTHHTVLVEGPENLQIKCYPGSLAQIVTNLISNTLIHGFKERDDGTIRIAFEAGDEKLQLFYEDDGCGIDPELEKKVFEPFITTRREHGSSGLGLHIVSSIVQQKLGGNIHIESKERAYTRFYIQFPMM